MLDWYPDDEEMERAYRASHPLPFTMDEEECPPELRQHPMIVHHDWSRGLTPARLTEAELRRMTGTEIAEDV